MRQSIRLFCTFAFVLQACSESPQEHHEGTSTSFQTTVPLNESTTTTLHSGVSLPIEVEPTFAAVSRQDYGDDWPFTFDTGVLGCEDTFYPYFKAGGHTYQLTPMKKPGYEDVSTIWRDNPSMPGTKYSLLEVIEVAMNYCKV